MISSYILPMLQVIITLLLVVLQPIVGRPIPMDSKVLKLTENNDEDTKKTNVGRHHCNDDASADDGYFRDPLEILGVKFSESIIKHLCKANVYMYADFVSDVNFPSDASRLCGSVCKAYQESMHIDQGVTVSLINSNCDYTGDTILEQHSANETHAATCPDLSTSCVCAYNVRCNRKTKLMKYTLTPNEKGYLKVLASDCGLSNYVT